MCDTSDGSRIQLSIKINTQLNFNSNELKWILIDFNQLKPITFLPQCFTARVKTQPFCNEQVKVY